MVLARRSALLLVCCKLFFSSVGGRLFIELGGLILFTIPSDSFLENSSFKIATEGFLFSTEAELFGNKFV